MSSDDTSVRISTCIEREAANYLAEMQIEVGEPLMVEKRGDCPEGNVDLTTNVYGIVMKDVTVYRYDTTISGMIKKLDGTEKIVDLTRKGKSDVVFIDLRERCRDVILALKKQEAEQFFLGKRCIYYDLQSILFSLDKLDVEESRQFILPSNVLPSHRFGDFDSCMVEIRKVDAVVRLGNLTSVSRNLLLIERSLPQFLDIATSQYAMFHPEEHVTYSSQISYLIEPQKYNLADDTMFEDTCSYLSFGAQKGVRLIAGPGRGRSACVVVETKKTPFHGMVGLLQKVQAMVRDPYTLNDTEYRKLVSQLKGLYVETSHSKRPQRFEIRGLAREGSNSKIIRVGDSDITVAQYFQQKYNLTLKEPGLPLVETLGMNKSTNYVPMELCKVSDYQRVKSSQQTPKMLQQLIRKCAVPPSILRQQIELTAQSLHLFDSEWLTVADIKVMNRPVSVGARLFSPPVLEFNNNERSTINQNNFTWSGRRYLATHGCKVWAAYAFLDPRDRLDRKEFEQFLVNYVKECGVRGVPMPEPTEWDVRDSKYATINDTFKFAAHHNCEFILTIHSDTGDSAHADIKFAERVYDITSQCIKLGTMRNIMVKNQRLTLSNIVNKSNVKLGGLNYTLAPSPIAQEILGTETLYIGFAMNHPGGGLGISGEVDGSKTIIENTESAPSVVGYAANIGANNEFDFVGDFVYQAALRDEKANVISDIVARCLEYYHKGRKHYPQRVVLYRNGCAEGQFRVVLQYEVPLIKHAMQLLGCKATVTVLVANKLQNVRFFKRNINSRDRPPEQNIPPGVVVDHTVVHPEFAEFFLNSHRALQGTTRTPKYTVLYDDNNFKLEQLENITFHLCFGHQIVFMPTSLPSPVYIANRYSERGRMLYQRWAEHDRRENVPYHDLSDKLCFYKSKNLFGRRVNA